ncbi:MAG: hypothetical protein E7001_08215 [Coriobacteriaceae bacterium]|nr:hypothetical protein [Coriobacteriaceae bacterium]
MSLINAIFTAAFDNNLVFTQVIGLVSVIILAGRPFDAVRFGCLLGLATAASGILGSALYAGFLAPWGTAYFAPAVIAVLNAAIVYAASAVMSCGLAGADRLAALRRGGMLSASAALLGVTLSNTVAFDAGTATAETLMGTAIGSGAGVFLAVVLFALVRQRVDDALVPKALRGLPISLVTASLMALAFSGVAGIAGGMFA